MGEWQPIETAPRNGKPVLLFLNPPLDTNSVCGWVTVGLLDIVVGWADGFGEYRDPNFGNWHSGFCEEGSADTEGYSSAIMLPVYPTHWKPLPEPPQ